MSNTTVRPALPFSFPVRCSAMALALCVVLAGSFSCLQAQRIPGNKRQKDAFKRYAQVMKRKPFRHHTEGRVRLARWRHDKPKALELLMKDYHRPRSFRGDDGEDIPYVEYARYTLAHLFGQHFDSHLYAEELEQLRADHHGPGDVWLWANTLCADKKDPAIAKAMEVARNHPDLIYRAAAIHALGELRDRTDVLTLIPEICADFPKPSKKADRRILVSVLSGAILAMEREMYEPDMDKAIRAYIGLLNKDVELTFSCKMVIARHLAATIGKDRRYIDPEPWIRLLDQKFKRPIRKGETVSAMSFFSMESSGDRICYLVDMSNSMMKPIDPALIKKGPLTGPRKKRGKRKRWQALTEDDIPWHLIVSRFDLAREHLKISLKRLEKGKRFCVLWFGDKSGYFKTTPGMIKATRGNVLKMCKELDAIKPTRFDRKKGETIDDAPFGKLKGQTNLHGGLRRAFSMRARGFAGEFGFTDRKSAAEGCDTIFLISDGAPSYDDFTISDRDYFEGRVVKEQEFKREMPRPKVIQYPGPFAQDYWIRQEVVRLNAFRKVQIHCVGIGEADIGLLRNIASVTMGEVFLFGALAKAAGEVGK